MPCSFYEEVENVKLLTLNAQTHDDGQRPIAIARSTDSSDSGDLKKNVGNYCQILEI